VISPVVAGGGRKRLFPADSPPTAFELVDATSTSTGAIIATYRPAASRARRLVRRQAGHHHRQNV